MIAARLAAAGAGSNGKSGGTPDPHAPSFIGMVYAPYTAQRGKLLASTGELLASTASADVRAHARTLPGPQKEWARANLPEGATMGPVRAALGGLAQCARRAADWARGIDGERAGAYPAGADAGGGTTSADDDESRKLLFASPRDATTALDVLEARRRKRLRAKRPSQWAQQQRSKAEERNAPGSGPDGGSRHEDDGEGGGGEKGRSAAGGSTASSRPVKTSPGGPTIATGATELPEEHRALLEELLGIKLVGGGASDGGDGGLRDASTDNAGDMGEDASDSSSESDEDGRVGGIALRDAVDLFLGSAVRHSPTGERRAPTCALLPAREDLVAARTLRKQETGVDAPFEGVPVFSADGLHIGLGETRQKQAQREAQRSQQARVPFGVPDQQGAVREKEEGDASDDVRGGNGDAVTVGGEGESSAGPLDVSATADAAASVTGSEDPGSGSLPLVDAEAGERARDGGSPFGDLLSDSLGAFGAGSDEGSDGNLGRVEVEVDQISEGGDWDTGEAVADDDAPSWRTPYFLSRAQLDKFTQLQLEVSCAACLEARREERRERERRAAARSGRGKGGTNGGGSDRGGGGPMGASGGGMGDDEDDIGEMDPPDGACAERQRTLGGVLSATALNVDAVGHARARAACACSHAPRRPLTLSALRCLRSG